MLSYQSLGIVLIATVAFSTALYAVKPNINQSTLSTKQVIEENINELYLDGPFNITLEQGDNPSVIKTDPTNADVVISIEDNRLIIRNKGLYQKAEVKITLKSLSSLQSKGRLTFKSNSPFKGEDLKINCSGIASVDLGQIDYNTISGQSTGLNIIVLKGKTNRVNIDFEGFGMLDNKGLEAKVLDIKNNSTGLLPTLSEMINKLDKI